MKLTSVNTNVLRTCTNILRTSTNVLRTNANAHPTNANKFWMKNNHFIININSASDTILMRNMSSDIKCNCILFDNNRNGHRTISFSVRRINADVIRSFRMLAGDIIIQYIIAFVQVNSSAFYRRTEIID